MQVTEHFNDESFWNNSETAHKYHINNKPSTSHMVSIHKLIKTILEPIRIKFGYNIRINSSYRCPELNKKVGGSTNSQHVRGEAADLAAIGNTNANLFKLILGMVDAGEITIGQMIWEFGTDRNPAWVHVSLYNGSKKNQILQAKKVRGKTRYVMFNRAILDTNYVVEDSENTTRERTDGLSVESTRKSLAGDRVITNEYKKQ